MNGCLQCIPIGSFKYTLDVSCYRFCLKFSKFISSCILHLCFTEIASSVVILAQDFLRPIWTLQSDHFSSDLFFETWIGDSMRNRYRAPFFRLPHRPCTGSVLVHQYGDKSEPAWISHSNIHGSSALNQQGICSLFPSASEWLLVKGIKFTN